MGLMPTPPILQQLPATQEEENIQERLTDPLHLIQVSKSSEESEHRVYGKHCSYRHSNFLLVDSSLNVFYRVTPFKQAQTSLFFNPIHIFDTFTHSIYTIIH